MTGQRSDLQSILARHDTGSLNPRERQVVSHVKSCRTVVLVGMRWGCDQCGHAETHYHSCRDRHCPKCQRRQSLHWRERQRADVLPVTYHHVVFTLPSSLNGWVVLHPELIYRTLFQCVWKTLAAFGADPKRLDGQIGMSAVLHTYGEALTRHVHVHCLVPGVRWAPMDSGTQPGAITCFRCLLCSQVSFRVKGYANEGARRTLTLDTGEFIRRYLLHSLPKGLMRVRHYGFMANRCRRQRLCEIRVALDVSTSQDNAPARDVSTTIPIDSDSDKEAERVCPVCKQGHLQVHCRIVRYQMTEN